jgi:hypothetical protein
LISNNRKDILFSSILLEVHMGRSKGAIDEETALRAQHELEIIK